jgi:4a-hydroxytetrahydrobiopterin dehydratase
MPQTVPEGWSLADNVLFRAITRADFVEALALVVEIGRLATAADHHPDIDIRYRTVQLSLSTHSAGNTVTGRDYALAQQINDLGEQDIRTITDDLRRRFTA